MGRTFRGVVARGGVAAILLGLLTAGGSAGRAADHAVDIAGFAFSPGSVTVAVGDTVTWSNADVQGHTATADNGSFDTGTIAGNSAKSVTFATAGTFPYHCKIHRSMTATVVVQAAAGATNPSTDAVAPEPAGPAGSSGIELALFAVAALGGVLLAQRRFGRRQG